MSKLKQLLLAVVLVAAPFAVVSSASAASTCEIGFTGPDSNNKCVSEQTYECEVLNETTLTVNSQNGQITGSGTAVVAGNTSGGGSQSGNSSNTNDTNYNFSVVNEVCTAVKTVDATPTKPAGGAGGVKKQPVVAPVQKTPPVLANTSADSAPQLIAGGLALAGALFAALRLGLFAYARR